MAVRHRTDGLVRAPAPQAARRIAGRASRRAIADRPGSQPGGAAPLGGIGPRPRWRPRQSCRGAKSGAADAHRSRAGLWRDRLRDGMATAEGEERDPPGPAPAPRESRRVSGRGGAMTHVPADELESLALDELSRDRAAQVEAHAAACPQCAHELSWLRAERTLLTRRPLAQTAHLWAGIAARLRHPRRRPHRAWRVPVGAAVAAAAAAGVLATVRPRPEPAAPQTPQATRQQRQRSAIDPQAVAGLDRGGAG